MHSIIIGAQKAETTTLFDILAQSPDIDAADVKEINFFGFRFDKGVRSCLSCFHRRAQALQKAAEQINSIISGGKAAPRQMPGGVQGIDPAALPTQAREELRAYFRADLTKLQQHYEFTSDWMASYGLDVTEAGK